MPKCINALKRREDITLQEWRRRIEVLTEQVRVDRVRVDQVRRDAEQKARELRLKQAAVQMGMLW